MSALTPAQVAALETLAALWRDVEYCLIGATAIHLQRDLPRQTNDLDISIVIDVSEYPKGIDSLPGWTQDAKREHRWFSPKRVKVDVIPAGGNQEEIIWPKSGMRMSLVGMRLAARKRILLKDGSITVPVATLPCVAILKMAAFLDRPTERDRDLDDLGYLLDQYVTYDDDRRFSEDVLDAHIFDEHASAFLLGTDILTVTKDQPSEGKLVARFLERALSEDTNIASRLGGIGILSTERERKAAREKIEALQSGFGR